MVSVSLEPGIFEISSIRKCVKFCSGRYGALSLIPAERVGKALARAKAEKFVEMARRGE